MCVRVCLCLDFLHLQCGQAAADSYKQPMACCKEQAISLPEWLELSVVSHFGVVFVFNLNGVYLFGC